MRIKKLKLQLDWTVDISEDAVTQSNAVVRSTDSIILIDKCSTIHEKCNKFHCDNASKQKKLQNKKKPPARAKTLLMNTSHDSVVLVLKEKRLECIQLKKE